MQEKFTLIECSIVAVARNHNPTILNPDFLIRTKIIPEGWETERVLCTDVLSQVVFKNGFVITAEPQKIIFTENNPERAVSRPSLDSIAVGYVRTLPHVTYTAVGVNFKGIVPFRAKNEAERFIIDRMLSAVPWKDLCGGLQSAAVRYTYPIDRGILNLSIEPVAFQRLGESAPTPAILSSANFHRDLPGDHGSAAERMKEIIKGWTNDRENLLKMIGEIYREEA